MSDSLYGKKISETYQKILQITSGNTIVNGNGVGVEISLSSAGTYTPTLTNISNLSSSSAYLCQYLKVGNIVTVSGKVVIDPINVAVLTKLSISLPIPSTFNLIHNCAGTAFATNVAGQGAAIRAASGNTEAEMVFVSNDVENHAMFFTFTYQILP